MSGSHEKRNLIIAGLIIGAIAGFLVLAGNPGNMGFLYCVLCSRYCRWSRSTSCRTCTVHSPRNYRSYIRGLCIVHDSWRAPK